MTSNFQINLKQDKTQSAYSSKTVYFEKVYGGKNTTLPILLYLPGLDGAGDYAKDAFGSISDTYEIWKLTVLQDDRTTFTALAGLVISFLSQFPEPVVIMGESFGGLLATYVSFRANTLVSKAILVNPATSFDQTFWPTVGTMITNTGPAFPIVGAATLALTIVEPYQIQMVGQSILDRIKTTEDAIREIGELLNIPNAVTKRLPVATLRWRLNGWLKAGTHIMNNNYDKITTPTLVLIGIKDRLLPSAQEGKRITKLMKNAVVEVQEFKLGGHALLDGTNNISAILSVSKVFTDTVTVGPSVPPPLQDYYPEAEDIALADKTLGSVFSAASPIFLSRDGNGNGKLIRGIEGVPTGRGGRPVLLVGNHQLLGADMSFLIREFLRVKQTMVRGLAHPIIFDDSMGEEMKQMRDFLQKFGAVQVSPSSLFQ
eukprot:gene9122-18894_t